MRNRSNDLPAIRIPPVVWWREVRVRLLLPLVSVAALILIVNLWPTLQEPIGASLETIADRDVMPHKQWTVGLQKRPKLPKTAPSHSSDAARATLHTNTASRY